VVDCIPADKYARFGGRKARHQIMSWLNKGDTKWISFFFLLFVSCLLFFQELVINIVFVYLWNKMIFPSLCLCSYIHLS
jgi:hypothetical protein